MNRNTEEYRIEPRVLAALEEVTNEPLSDLRTDDDLVDRLGLNSMDTLRFIVKLEQEYGITIGDDVTDFERIRTLGGVSALLRERTQRGT